MNDSRRILDISKLIIGFNGKDQEYAVKGLSQIVRRGKILGIVGESGSGKSVTAMSILKLLPSGSNMFLKGSISYLDKDGNPIELLSLSENEIRKYRGSVFSMIFQEPMTSLNPVFRCGEQVAEVIRLHLGESSKAARSRTLELFEKVKLTDAERIYESYPHQLSGGQKQRVMIAMALSCNPEVLIADEPTTALDVTVQANILKLLKSLQEELQMTVIFITHDLGVVAEIADEVAVMYKGEIVEYGETAEIFKNPRHSYTKGLIACRPPLRKRLRRLPTISDYLNTTEMPHSTAESPEISRDKIDFSGSDMILQVNGLSITYTTQSSSILKSHSKIRALDNVSFFIHKGETLGLVGESGSGKSTLGKAIARLIDVDQGEILFKGVDLLKLSRSELRKVRPKIQMIFQDPYASLNPRMKIGEAILEPMMVHKLKRNRKEAKPAVEMLLEKVGLDPGFFNRYPHEFSGGQRQRIGIARALALEPEFIICDESVSALDVSVQAQVLNLLADLREEFELTYLFITHDLSVVNFIADRIMVLRAGAIEEIGHPSDIFQNTKSDYTRKLIDSVPGV